ncbi:hypothetical protein JCM9279_007132 [Rhodotorula babjevae]
MVREVGDLNAAGAWAAAVRAAVAAGSARNPDQADDIVKYGTAMCIPSALARFDQLNTLEREQAMRKLQAWRNGLLAGEVKRSWWGHMMAPDERSRALNRARGIRFRKRKADRAALAAHPDQHREQPPPPRLVLPSQSRSRMPSPDLDDDFLDWDASWLHQDLVPPAHGPPLLDPSQGFAAYPFAGASHQLYPAPHMSMTHSYPHAAHEYCPQCNLWPTASPSFAPGPSSLAYHPGPRDLGASGPHVLESSIRGGQHELERR